MQILARLNWDLDRIFYEIAEKYNVVVSLMSLRVMNEINFKEFYDHLSRPHKENKGMQKWLDDYSEKWFKRCAK